MPSSRVRHYTSDAGLEAIRVSGHIVASRGWGEIAYGVHVELEPFGSTRPSRPGRPGPKDQLGSKSERAYVEFDAPLELLAYRCGQRNTAVIPVAFDASLSLTGLNPVYVKVRQHWWEFWRV
jgi:hypothetical protein